LTKAVLSIKSSRIQEEVIPVIDDLSQGGLLITNEGWGAVVDPALQFTVSEADGDVPLFAPKLQTLNLPSFEEIQRMPIGDYLPDRLKYAETVRVTGRITYGQPAKRQSLSFATRVALGVKAGHAVLPDHRYNVYFKAGEIRPVEFELIPRRELKPGESDVFPIRIRSDKSSQTSFDVSFRTNGGEMLPAKDVVMDIFVPRSKVPLARKDVGGGR
jgi:hypothetical protein